MTRIAISDLFKPVEIDLWGREYKSVPITKAVKAEILRIEAEGKSLDEEIAAMNGTSTDEDKEAIDRRMVALKARILSCRFQPVGQQRKPVAEVLMEKYDTGDVGEDEIDLLLEAVGDAARPT